MTDENKLAEDKVTTETTPQKKLLSRKDLLLTWWRWISWAQRCYNYERMMGLGFCQAISNSLEKLYTNKEELKESLVRHMRFYNTENNWGAIIIGATTALEEERAQGQPVDTETIGNLKSALMGPLAGIGDSVTQSIIKVILLGIGVSLATAGNAFGPILFVLGFTIYTLAVSYTMFFSGYRTGRDAVTRLLTSDLAKSVTSAMKIVSMIVVGALAAGNIRANTIVKGTFGESEFILQDVLDSILPKLLPLLVLLFVLWLLRKRKKTPIFILLSLFVIGFVLTFLNILG